MERYIPNTLFPYPDTYIEQCKKQLGITVSKEFVECANAQLTPLFEKEVGFKVNNHVELYLSMPRDQEFFLRIGPVTKLSCQLIINTRNFWVTMSWKSTSGRIYYVGESDIDCSDIEFWLEGIDALAYNKQMYPNVGQPFKLKDLTYELIIDRLNMDCNIQLQLKKGVMSDTAKLLQKVDDFIGEFNEKSEKNNRIDGVVHNWKHFVEDDLITYEMDLGSARASFLKKLLQFFSKLNVFSSVRVE
ncbi:hypothetical protein [Sediminibacterium ginsengisoli]|uniref:Uncharacterized protein n=1 Tax=Sediminibacterium ginsengisoli TaxID=413434 RepID=A0A1T4NYA6_9BACT|nr:hypothetical protein [Sediminibacterium ginsengisoli]SJZ84243.1 hypothetical protein SAMN04488132_10554 [Sediminibacterium ginsengisoli]